MTVYDYCAIKNPSGTAKVISSFGMRPAREKRELSKQICYLAKRNGGEVLRRITLIHPDRALFEHERKLKEKKLSAASREAVEQVRYGLPEKSDKDFEKERLAQQERERLMQKSESESKLLSQNNLIIGGVLILGLAIIMKK